MCLCVECVVDVAKVALVEAQSLEMIYVLAKMVFIQQFLALRLLVCCCCLFRFVPAANVIRYLDKCTVIEL